MVDLGKGTLDGPTGGIVRTDTEAENAIFFGQNVKLSASMDSNNLWFYMDIRIQHVLVYKIFMVKAQLQLKWDFLTVQGCIC